MSLADNLTAGRVGAAEIILEDATLHSSYLKRPNSCFAAAGNAVPRAVDHASARPIIAIDETFWFGMPPRLCESAKTGLSCRWRSPARPRIWR